MPAIKKPVKNLKENKDRASVASHAIVELVNAPSRELRKKSLTGENLSAREKNANTRVPVINPSITAEVTWLRAYCDRCNDSFSSGNTAFPTNQSEVPANCDNTITGRIFFLLILWVKRFQCYFLILAMTRPVTTKIKLIR